jgi:nicotinamidase-related amidase
MQATAIRTSPLPNYFNARTAGEVRRVDYNSIAKQAADWGKANGIKHASQDKDTIAFQIIDAQMTFCFPDFELPVMGAVADCVRTAEFIYKYMNVITHITPTMDTHTAMQIFHPIAWVNSQTGEHPSPGTMIPDADIQNEVWVPNPAIAYSLSNGDYVWLKNYFKHYSAKLAERGRYALIIWPYHSMLMGIGHAIVPILEEAFFSHNIARGSQTAPEIKGGNPYYENYSIYGGEVLKDHTGRVLGQKNTRLFEKLIRYKYLLLAGQAKSHCVAWTIDDLLTEIMAKDPSLVKKIYIMEDLTSPVIVKDAKGNVIPGLDFTKQGNDAFDRFKNAGAHVVKSTTPMEEWPDFELAS